MLISHHFHDCKAPLAHASHVKWRYTKYLGFSFSFRILYLFRRNASAPRRLRPRDHQPAHCHWTLLDDSCPQTQWHPYKNVCHLLAPTLTPWSHHCLHYTINFNSTINIHVQYITCIMTTLKVCKLESSRSPGCLSHATNPLCTPTYLHCLCLLTDSHAGTEGDRRWRSSSVLPVQHKTEILVVVVDRTHLPHMLNLCHILLSMPKAEHVRSTVSTGQVAVEFIMDC